MKHQRHLSFFLLFSCFVAFPGCVAVKKMKIDFNEFHFTGLAQGTSWHIIYFSIDSSITHKQIDSIFIKIDSSLSIYKSYSLISRFNNAPEEIEMDEHLKIIVDKSLEIYNETEGISDITVYPLVQAWGFGKERRGALPDSAMIQSLLSCVGSDKIVIDHNQLRKTRPCIKIDVNGIAQGYTADVIADFLEKRNIQNYLVEIGGELRVKGHKYPAGDLFQVGIESPAKNSLSDPVIKKVIQFEQGAVTTSGNYRKYFDRGGKIISHLMNPKTGFPVENEMVSVTIFTKDAMTADGYDNALMGMGLKKSLLFLHEHKEMEAFFIYRKPDGSVGDTASAGFYRMFVKDDRVEAKD